MKYHMRRTDKEFNDTESMHRVIKEAEYVTLAMVKDSEPYLVSLSHGYDEERNLLYFHSASEGKKLDYLRANPVVWGQALLDHGYALNECTHRYASVMFKGRVRFIENLEEKRHAFSLMIYKLEPNPEKMMERLLSAEGLQKPTIGEITIEYMTGKKTPELTL